MSLVGVSHAKTTTLRVTEKTISVNGKNATVYTIVQPDGTAGLYLQSDQPFDVDLENTLQVLTSIHWHGLILPNNQDGVAFVTQFPIYPGLSYHYQFPLVQAGTFWMHSHVGLQEQKLLSAPLIIRNAEDASLAEQEVVIFLADFTFKNPEEIMEDLRCKNKSSNMAGMHSHGAHDVVEVDYDAFLTNDRTLENVEITEVKAESKIRLRCINGSSATNFLIDLGTLQGEAIAVDGNRIHPLKGSQFELAIAQRIDIIVRIPKDGGAFPILAKGEGTNMQTGVILATKDSVLPKISEKTAEKAGILTNKQEAQLRALHPLKPKNIDNKILLELGGDMANYRWTINGQTWPEVTPAVVEKGQRVEITFKNTSSMAHPMHLHGHVFQVTAIDGQKIDGAMRDTVLVMPESTLSIQFDADNPGVWPLHCHLLYHLEAGMMTVLRYKDFKQPL
jgi:FtsP/CotA-like multicopper oxidase with cupredoxin domain